MKIDISNLSVLFDDQIILDDISLTESFHVWLEKMDQENQLYLEH